MSMPEEFDKNMEGVFSGGEPRNELENVTEDTVIVEETPQFSHQPYEQQEEQPYTGQVYQGDVQQVENEQPYAGQVYPNDVQQVGSEQPYAGQVYPNDVQQMGSEQPYTGQIYPNHGQQPYTGQIVPGGGQQMYTGSVYQNGGGQPYNGQAYQGNGQQPYTGQAYQGNVQQPYTGQVYQGNGQIPQNMNQGYGTYSQPSYQNPTQNPYANQPYQGNGQGYGGGGVPPYGYGSNNPYSPYAAPQRKKNTGLIVTIVVVLVLLFAALFAMIYKVMKLNVENGPVRDGFVTEGNSDITETFPNYPYEGEDPAYDGEDYNGYFYGDYGDDNYDDDEYYDNQKYYELHDAVEEDLSYSVTFESYEYDTDNEDVVIMADYPVIEGENVPNLKQINKTIYDKAMFYVDVFKESVEDNLGEDGYYGAYSGGYVTYMDEEKMSVVFSESLMYGGQEEVYLTCINIDMEKGIILENPQILSIDDDFSVDFREKSNIQNGEIDDLTYMTDQQITAYFNSDNIIVFYTPKGMEIGFNYENGWVTATYEDYEQYLKVF